MRYRGINYDTGIKTTTGKLTREIFDILTVSKEIGIIREDLHCNAVRISGMDISRMVKASEIALKLDLTVFFSPALHHAGKEETWEFLLESAAAAESLRKKHPNLIFIAGCELSLFSSGFIKGATGLDRMQQAFSIGSLIKNSLGISRTYNKRLNGFLSEAVVEIRKKFGGLITYASGTWEKIDWSLFDLVGVDLYLSAHNRSVYTKQLRHYQQPGKPLIITEFGCCCYQGAEEKGAMGWAIVDWQKEKPELKGRFIRDEAVQARYLSELLQRYAAEKVSGVFAFTFAAYNYPHEENPRYDLDMASYGIVKVLKETGPAGYQDLPWLPKQAFFALAGFYKSHGH